MDVRDDLNKCVTRLESARRTMVSTASTVPDLRTLANVLAPVLADPRGQLNTELADLWSRIGAWPRPGKAVFVPKPEHPRGDRATVWWLQLLVMVAQGHAAQRRRIVPTKLDPAMKDLPQVQALARRAVADYTQHRGARKVTDQMIEALRCLLAVLPTGLTLEGRAVLYNGRWLNLTPPLSPQEKDFLRLLIEAEGKSVSDEDFSDGGISYPKKLKVRLLKKDASGTLRRLIRSDRERGYRLRQD